MKFGQEKAGTSFCTSFWKAQFQFVEWRAPRKRPSPRRATSLQRAYSEYLQSELRPTDEYPLMVEEASQAWNDIGRDRVAPGVLGNPVPHEIGRGKNSAHSVVSEGLRLLVRPNSCVRCRRICSLG